MLVAYVKRNTFWIQCVVLICDSNFDTVVCLFSATAFIFISLLDYAVLYYIQYLLHTYFNAVLPLLCCYDNVYNKAWPADSPLHPSIFTFQICFVYLLREIIHMPLLTKYEMQTKEKMVNNHIKRVI